MPEELLIQHCSPTLAGVKTGNLFTTDDKDETVLLQEIAWLNQRLSTKGLQIMFLGHNRMQRSLIYVYRTEQLQKDLSTPEAQTILKEAGYQSTQVQECLKYLMQRIAQHDTFPHEIGLFLGYPVEDVKGFIENKEPCKCYGTWKVYGNVQHAKHLFEIYDACTRTYQRQYALGASLEYLTVRI